ncbi:L-seryl-tRNA(Sec) kinase-like [Ylistrum balloti]|uniref:L-seryl-tRNA(Sec) kinase-like n=1 Tax=Ylistrum balloti TaxID=509963 RepID=UPI002905BC57|nr:L-seryl-tRNA(Sec) kinase-like [Ylistrum balloti]
MCEIENVPSPSVCILVLSGLPGSGKSSLARSFKTSHVKSSSPSIPQNIKSVSGELPWKLEGRASLDKEVAHDTRKENFNVILISYDELIPEEKEAQMIQSGIDSEWKTCREQIVNCVESLVHCLLSNKLLKNMVKPTDDEALWERFCHVIHNQEDDSMEQKGDKSSSYVLIIDDNMYYRSMRYRYFQLARKFEQGFCQVHLHCTENIAKERNSKRKVRRVTDEVITTMATKMEVPDPSIDPWEKYFAVLEGSTDFQSQLCDIDRLLQLAILNPPHSPVEDSQGKEESRQICSVNQLHQADQILRKLVSSRIKQTGTAMSQQEKSQFAKFCSMLKSQILKELRAGTILVPTNMPTMDASKMEDCQFYKFVETIFNKRT